MRIAEYIRPELSLIEQGPVSRDDLLRTIAQRLAEATGNPDDAGRIFDTLLAREEKGSTATPEGVAFPHAMLSGLDKSHIAVVLVPGGVDFYRKDAPPSDVIITLLGPQDRAWEHLRLLARAARICCHADALTRLRAAESPNDLHQRLLREDESHA